MHMQQRSQSFCLFFSIFPLFPRFFLVSPVFVPIFDKIFAVRGVTLPPWPPVATPLCICMVTWPNILIWGLGVQFPLKIVLFPWFSLWFNIFISHFILIWLNLILSNSASNRVIHVANRHSRLSIIDTVDKQVLHLVPHQWIHIPFISLTK